MDGHVQSNLIGTEMIDDLVRSSSVNGTAAQVGATLLARDGNFKFAVYRTLRQGIVEGRITAGTRLVEADLAHQFGVSKTPVREALVMLESEGLVILRPHQGCWVKYLSLAEFAEALFLFDALEFAALDLVMAEMTEQRLGTARALAATMEAAAERHDITTYRQTQRQLHAVLHVPTGYHLLEKSVMQIMDTTDRYHRLTIAAYPEQLSLDMERTHMRVAAMTARDASRLTEFIRASHSTLLNNLRRAVQSNQGDIAILFIEQDRDLTR